MTIQDSLRRLSPMHALRATGPCQAACSGIAVLTYAMFVLQVSLTTIGLLFLLIVFSAALYFGFCQASLALVLAAQCPNSSQPFFPFYIFLSRPITTRRELR